MTMTARYEWLRIDHLTLGLSGYPIKIRRETDGRVLSFTVLSEGDHPRAAITLEHAKERGEHLAAELAEFMPELMEE
jgi:hypothetical protein